MNELPSIEAEVTLFPKKGFDRPPIYLPDSNYRPHLVVGDPGQKDAVLDGNVIKETYLGVEFKYSPTTVEFNKPFLAELTLMYYPHPIYDSLVPGATFTIREGAQIVGHGQVKRWLGVEKGE